MFIRNYIKICLWADGDAVSQRNWSLDIRKKREGKKEGRKDNINGVACINLVSFVRVDGKTKKGIT
jgi:hypothetical protein